MKIKNILKIESIEKNIVELICFVVVCLGVITSIRMNLERHSLWWDEAALAYSFSKRDLLNLTSVGLEKLQSAPVGWLYLLKIITLFFGNTDYVLRIPSMLAYIGTIILVYWILKKVFKVLYPMAGAAFFASMPIIIQYSNIFKPYMTDCFFSLLVIIMFYLYGKRKIGWIKLGIVTSVLIWFSNPVCFVAGGLYLSLLIDSIINKDRNRIFDEIRMCMMLFASFVYYYFYWLRQTATDQGMLFYWQDWNLPLFPNGVEDLLQIKKCAETIFSEFYRLEYIIIILLIACVGYAFKKWNWIYSGVLIGFLVCCFASGINKFPVNKRLWLYIYPLIIIVIMVCLDELLDRESRKNVSTSIIGIVLLGCCILNGGIRYYWDLEHTYWPRYEVKMGYQYLIDHIQEDEAVYVCVNQTPIFDYYNQYVSGELNTLGNKVFEGDNPYLAPYDYKKDVQFITENEKCYIISGDGWNIEGFVGPLFETLFKMGYLEMVFNPYETPVWYFTTDLKNSKTEVNYEILYLEDGVYLRVCNVGETYLNTLYEDVKVCVFDENQEIIFSQYLKEDMEPHTYFDIKLDETLNGNYSVNIISQYGELDENKEVLIER